MKARAHIAGAEFFESMDGQKWLARLVIALVFIFGIGAILAPFIKERKILLGIVSCGIMAMVTLGVMLGWNHSPPAILSIPAIQSWIFDYPTAAGSRALMIGIGLGIVGTSFRIILGIERSFLGD